MKLKNPLFVATFATLFLCCILVSACNKSRKLTAEQQELEDFLRQQYYKRETYQYIDKPYKVVLILPENQSTDAAKYTMTFRSTVDDTVAITERYTKTFDLAVGDNVMLVGIAEYSLGKELPTFTLEPKYIGK